MMARTAIHPLKILAAVGAAFLLWGLVLAYASSPAHAAATTFTVDRTDDPDLSTTPTAGACTAAANDCSLRGAITAANANSGDDTIDIQTTGTVNLTGVLPDLSTNMAIKGPGADKFTVRRSDTAEINFRIFHVTGGTVVSISGITISNGIGELVGGGVFNEDGSLTISDSTISNNSANSQGGGVANTGGNLTISHSTIRDNTVPGAHGGGVAELGGGGSLTIKDSTISGNSAHSQGGGVYSSNHNAQSTITNSTISGNSASEGGGVNNVLGLTVIEFSTITNNTTPRGLGSGVASEGDDNVRTEVLSSIVAANQGTDVDVVGSTNSFASKGYNLIGSGGATGAFDQTGDQTGVTDPKLDPLDSYGGPTQTHRLKADSPAIDAGPLTAGDPKCPPPGTDQRGFTRPQDGNGDSTSRCDIGAFELQPSALSIDDVRVTEGNSGFTEATFTFSLSKPSSQTVTVDFATADGTATDGSDYEPASGTVIFNPGETSVEIPFALIRGDTAFESDETFFVNLSNPTGAEISDDQGIITIVNDDPPPDTTAPTTTVALDPATPNGQNGWYKSAVNLTVSATDETGGSGVEETRCVLDPASAPTSFDDLPTSPCPYLGSGADVSADGQHTLYAASIDEEGNKEAIVSKGFKIDKTAPSVSCSVSPNRFSVPANNHKLVTVRASVQVNDNTGGSGANGFTLVSVSSNQPQRGLASDDVPNDIQGWMLGTPDIQGQLRTERYGGARTYTLTYQGKDLAGNTKNCQATVTVPKGG